MLRPQTCGRGVLRSGTYSASARACLEGVASRSASCGVVSCVTISTRPDPSDTFGKAESEAAPVDLDLGRQIGFWAPKGGSGATTLALNVAAAACEYELRVAYADLDPDGGDAALFSGSDAVRLGADPVGGEYRHPCGLRIHVAHDDTDARALTTGLRAGSDLVVIDLPSAVLPTGVACDLLVLVVGCSLAALSRARRAIDAWDGPPPPVCVVAADIDGSVIKPGDVGAVMGVECRAFLPHDPVLAPRGDRGAFSYGLHRNTWARNVRTLVEDLCAGLAPHTGGGP